MGKPIKMETPSGETKEITSGYSGLWAFFFGPFYLAYRGLWKWLSIALAFIIFMVLVEKNFPYEEDLVAIIWFVYFIAWVIFGSKFGNLLVKRYEQDGWKRIQDD